MLAIKCVIVGDGGVGKTSLLISYVTNQFPEEYVPTIFDNYTTNHVFHGKSIKLNLFDTPGQDGFDKLRPLSYSETDIFLVCFSLVTPDSFSHVRDKWYPEIHLMHPNARIILVGTKMDLRGDKETLEKLRKHRASPISTNQGIQMAKFIKAVKYMECSSLSKVGVTRIFEEVIRSMFAPNKPLKKKEICSIS